MRFVIFFLFGISSLAAQAIVFIHLGSKLPHYLSTAIAQARLFNPDCPIYLVLNQNALLFTRNSNFAQYEVQCIFAESLMQTDAHRFFKMRTRLDRTSLGGLWLYSTERFFYLAALMKQHNLSDVIHLESDVMLYTDVEELLPALHGHYRGKIGATFDNDGRCIAGIVYASDSYPVEQLTQFIANNAWKPNNDMYFLAEFGRLDGGRWIERLPIVMPNYAKDHPLISAHEHRAEHPEMYFNHFDDFISIFDAAAIGQYLGGIDPIHQHVGAGFINESCVFNPSYFQYEWIVDAQGRRVPVAIYKNEAYKINNLHVHCKDLKSFYSGVVP